MVLVRWIKLLWRNTEEGELGKEEGDFFRIQLEIISTIRCLWGKLEGSSAPWNWPAALQKVFIWNIILLQKG